MDDGNNGNVSPVPVPKPRRHIILGNEFNGKQSYENVSIDAINKNIDIKNENLQNSSKNKIPLNKTFMIPSSSSSLSPAPPPPPSAAISTSANSAANDGHMINVLTELNDLQATSKDVNRNLASALDEVNKLSNIYSDDENVKHKPVPAPRRSNASSLERDTNLASSTSHSTGAISKISNKSLYPSLENVKKSKCSGSYSFASDDTDSIDFAAPPKYTLNKSASMSNSSLASTQSGSSNTESSPGTKYHTTSPG